MDINNLIKSCFTKEHEFGKTIKENSPDEELYLEIVECQKDIFKHFGLPHYEKFIEVLYDYPLEAKITDQLVANAIDRLTKAAKEYLLTPILMDIKILLNAQKKKAFMMFSRN